jgi:hypothetical protein
LKILARPIEVLAHTDIKGNMSPLRFKAKTKDNENLVISIDKIESQELEKMAGNMMMLYKCKGVVGDKQRDFELKFEIKNCRWMLWKI